jgi:hypothetical protein
MAYSLGNSNNEEDAIYTIEITFEGELAEKIKADKRGIIGNGDVQNCLSNYGIFYNDNDMTYIYKGITDFSIVRVDMEHPEKIGLQTTDEYVYNNLVGVQEELAELIKQALEKYFSGAECPAAAPPASPAEMPAPSAPPAETKAKVNAAPESSEYYSVELSLDSTELQITFHENLAEVLTTEIRRQDHDFNIAADNVGLIHKDGNKYISVHNKYPPLDIGIIDNVIVISGADEPIVFSQEMIDNLVKDMSAIVSFMGYYREQHVYNYTSPQSPDRTPNYNSNDPYLTNENEEEPDMRVYYKSTGEELEGEYHFIIINSSKHKLYTSDDTSVLTGVEGAAAREAAVTDVLKLFDARLLCVDLSRDYTKEAIETGKIIILMKDKGTDRIMGFVAIELYEDKPLYISLICGNTDYQNVGSILMNKVKSIGREMDFDSIILHAVMRDYVLKFYKKHKFLPFGRRAGPSNHVQLMKRRLRGKEAAAAAAAAAALNSPNSVTKSNVKKENGEHNKTHKGKKGSSAAAAAAENSPNSVTKKANNKHKGKYSKTHKGKKGSSVTAEKSSSSVTKSNPKKHKRKQAVEYAT